MRSFVFLLRLNYCSSITFGLCQTCNSSFRSFSCTLSLVVTEPFCVFKILKFVDFFHIRKMYGEVWKRNMKAPLECLLNINVANYAFYRFLLSNIQISFNHKKILYVRTFLITLILEVWLTDYY